MPDASHLDQQYFVDRYVYNCPFCNRRHVSYSVIGKQGFDWTENKKSYAYFVQCHSCKGVSTHLSYTNISLFHYLNQGSQRRYHFGDYDSDSNVQDIDSNFFYSVPTSFFVLDSRIPRVLRELMSESESCLKGNLLTGASACARKIVYELATLQKASGDSYEERIKSLKTINSSVEAAYFDTLLTIQQITSSKVHEESYDVWDSKHLTLILSTLAEILREIYVVPATRQERRKAILNVKDEVLGRQGKACSSRKAMKRLRQKCVPQL